MANSRKYEYLVLKENFYDSPSMILLESMPDGMIYSNILMKMYLKSIKNNGTLILTDVIPYNAQMIAAVTHYPLNTVEKALRAFEELGLIEILDDGVIYRSDILGFSSGVMDAKVNDEGEGQK